MSDHLKPFQFQAGNNANPSGRPKLTDDERLAYTNCKRAIAMLGVKTVAEIAEIANNPKALAIEKACAKLLKDYFEKGSSRLIEIVFDRILGKSTQPIELANDSGLRIIVEDYTKKEK